MALKFHSTLFLLLVFSLVLVLSCRKEKLYPLIPAISFKSINELDTVYNIAGGNDTNTIIKFTFSFTDGDGDIGFRNEELPDQQNCFFRIFEKQQGDFVELVYPPPLFAYRIPDVTPDRRNKNISGEVTIDINENNFKDYPPNDTMKVGIYIFDRALNQSNTIFTSEFIINKP